MYSLDEHKAHLFPERVCALLNGEPVAPLQIEISPSSVCNQRCNFCAFDYVSRRRMIVTEDILKIIMDMPDLGVKSVVFAGEGEPLLHPDIATMVRTARYHDILCGMSTNGAMFTQRLQKEILPHLTWLRFSINSTERGNYAEIHGSDTFDTVIKNIKSAIGLKTSCTIGAQILLLPENAIDFFSHIYRLCDLGVDYVSIKPYSHHPKSKHSPQDLGALKHTMRSLMTSTILPEKVYFRENAFKRLFSDKPYHTCWGSRLFCFIAASGDVYPCAQCVGDRELKLGSIKRAHLKRILFSDQAIEVNELIQKMDTYKCRRPCRLDAVNAWLERIKHKKGHDLFL